MPCFNPLQAYQAASGEVVFYESSRHDIVRSLSLPCGQCIGCRLERSRKWAMRCVHEASLYERNCFITLTYNDEYLPKRSQLQYSDFQKFLKRLRKFAEPEVIRFYMCGEYGTENWRPHYHAIIFNFDFLDKVYYRRSPAGEKIFRSDILDRLWPFGFCSVGSVTFQSAAYVARYCVQKVTGFNARYHYARKDDEGEYFLVPEFNKMSLKPGIGAEWLRRFTSDVYPRDFVVVNGVECSPPRYYDKVFSRSNPVEFEDIQFLRESDGRSRYEDNTPERLAVKEVVQKARIRSLIRSV